MLSIHIHESSAFYPILQNQVHILYMKIHYRLACTQWFMTFLQKVVLAGYSNQFISKNKTEQDQTKPKRTKWNCNTVKPRKWLILVPVKKPSFAKTVIFKLLLDSYRKTIILWGLRWPLNVICEEWELNANRHLARYVTCKAVLARFYCTVWEDLMEITTVFPLL